MLIGKLDITGMACGRWNKLEWRRWPMVDEMNGVDFGFWKKKKDGVVVR